MLELEECIYTFGRDQNKEMSLEITKPIQTTLPTESSMFSHIDGMCKIYCGKTCSGEEDQGFFVICSCSVTSVLHSWVSLKDMCVNRV